jgi:hypothetical protein
VSRVEGLHARLVVAVERGHLAGVPDADVVTRGVGEPHTDLVEVDPKALLGPLPGRARVEEGVAEGWIVRGSGASLGETRRWKSRRRVLDALAEDRAE